MKGSETPKRTDVILPVAMLALAILVAGVIVATASTEEFVAWAWARHHNVLSWYVRPLFILPFCYFAYRRSLLGIGITLLALATSMFWFPAPEHTSPAVNEMLRAEKDYLTSNWTAWKVAMALLVPLTFAALGLAFWKRSLVWGLAVINAAILFKIAWTFLFSTGAGALSHLPAAVLGLVVCDALILYVIRRMRVRSSHERPRPGENTMARRTSGSMAATRIAQDGGTNVDGKSAATQTGTFLGKFSYVRFGSGSENLVILPGITLNNEPPNQFAAWTYRLGFGRFAKDYTVYVINRRRGMPPGYTIQDMAADYAAVLEQELGPSHLMAFSTGGDIAQYVAIDHPAAVRSLLLVVSACRLSEEGRQTCERWQALVREGRWRELRAEMASVNVTSETSKRLARAFMKVFGRFILKVPSDPRDFLTTLEADLDHDTTERLGEISALTLIIGGTEDPFFSKGILQETAEKIPDATLCLYEGVGHGVPKERKRRYEQDALAFLGDHRVGSSGQGDRTTSPRAEEMR
jgi:pimeloyl-ACP methyl ester carboxylesterase